MQQLWSWSYEIQVSAYGCEGISCEAALLDGDILRPGILRGKVYSPMTTDNQADARQQLTELVAKWRDPVHMGAYEPWQEWGFKRGADELEAVLSQSGEPVQQQQDNEQRCQECGHLPHPNVVCPFRSDRICGCTVSYVADEIKELIEAAYERLGEDDEAAITRLRNALEAATKFYDPWPFASEDDPKGS